jgi:hypothetical protein
MVRAQFISSKSVNNSSRHAVCTSDLESTHFSQLSIVSTERRELAAFGIYGSIVHMVAIDRDD